MSHQLVERFGSIGNIARASIDELKLVDGIGNESAILINLVMKLARRCASEERRVHKRLNTLKKLVAYADSYFFGATDEQVFLVMMDNTLRVMETRLICIGSVDEAKPLIRGIIELIVLKRATAVALTHNHPNGGVEASRADVEFTLLFLRELELIGVRFIDHIIVDGLNYTAVLEELEQSQCGGNRRDDRDYSLDDLRVKNR